METMHHRRQRKIQSAQAQYRHDVGGIDNEGISRDGEDRRHAVHREDDVAHLDLICVQFPAAGDGRGYSQAKLLRDRLGFKNEIRAIGEVLTDQLFLMRRSGINAFDLQADQDPEASLARLRPFSVSYQ